MKKFTLLLSSMIFVGAIVASFTYSNQKVNVEFDLPQNEEPSLRQILLEPVRLQNIWSTEITPISDYSNEEIEIQKEINKQLGGQYALSYNHIPDEKIYNNRNYDFEVEDRNIDNEPITPFTWKVIYVKMNLADGSILNAQLRRPNWWLKHNNADEVGNSFHMAIDEMGIEGMAEVVKITVNQIDTRVKVFEDEGNYTYRPLTGWFERVSNDTWDYEFSNGEKIGSTSNHPFFSEDRQSYIPIGEIEIGERIKVKGEQSADLVSKIKRDDGTDKVYNLEVYRDHNYHVGESGLLVHNDCLIGTIQRIAHKLRYTNLKNKVLIWADQSTSDIRRSIEAASKGNVGKKAEAKVAKAIQEKNGEGGVTGFGVEVKRENRTKAGDKDVETPNELIEVKAGEPKPALFEQMKKYADIESDDFMNYNAKKVILYMDKPGVNPNHPVLNQVKQLDKKDGIEVQIIIGSITELKNAIQ